MSDAQIAEWKSKYGKIYFFGIDEEGEEHIGGYFRTPTDSVLKAAKHHNDLKEDWEAMSTLYVNCKLLVSPEVEHIDYYKRSVCSQFDVLISSGKMIKKKGSRLYRGFVFEKFWKRF